MLQEIQMDVDAGNIYISNYLNPQGQIAWPDMLRDAAQNGDDDALAIRIRADSCLKIHVERRKPKGGFTTVKVPVTAHETMAEGEFNRYYCRGLCRRAIEDDLLALEVYRAKEVLAPRQASQEKIGQLVDPQTILADLRATQGVEPARPSTWA